jgi:hypothetical protein
VTVDDYGDRTTTADGDTTTTVLDASFATMVDGNVLDVSFTTMVDVDALDVSSASMADNNATTTTLDLSFKQR